MWLLNESWFLHAGSDGLADIIVGSILGVLFLVTIFWCTAFCICLQVSRCPLHNVYYKRTIQNLAEAPPMHGHPGMRAEMQAVWLHHTFFSIKPSRRHSDNEWYCMLLFTVSQRWLYGILCMTKFCIHTHVVWVRPLVTLNINGILFLYD